VNAQYRVDEKTGTLMLALPSHLEDGVRQACNVILKTLYVSVMDLKEGYSEYIEVEVK